MDHVASIQAWKPCHDKPGCLVVTELDDPAATRFSLRSVGLSTAMDFDTRLQAERVQYALIRAFEAGRKDFAADLRHFIGAASR